MMIMKWMGLLITVAAWLQGMALTRDEGIGLFPFFNHSSISTIGGNCYIQDLFVSATGDFAHCGVLRVIAILQQPHKKP